MTKFMLFYQKQYGLSWLFPINLEEKATKSELAVYMLNQSNLSWVDLPYKLRLQKDSRF